MIDNQIADHLSNCLENESVRQTISFMIIDSGGDIKAFVEQFRLTTLKMWAEIEQK